MADATKPTVRPIRIKGAAAYVTLTRGYEAVIDAADAELVGRWNWIAHVQPRRSGEGVLVYAVRTEYGGGKRRYIRMHRLIAGTPDGMETDHQDGDGLNNRRGNLRTATKSQNMHNQRLRIDNKSGVKGVCFAKETSKWKASIALNGTQRHLGYFTTKGEAADAYAKASLALHGDFGRSTKLTGVMP